MSIHSGWEESAFRGSDSGVTEPLEEFVGVQALLAGKNRNINFGRGDMQHATDVARHHFDLIMRYLLEVPGRLSRAANPEWNDARRFDQMLRESPVGYVVHERLPNLDIDDVCYRCDVIQTRSGTALRIIQDIAGTIKLRKELYYKRYEGLVGEEKEEAMGDLLRSLLSNLRKDLASDIEAAMDKATSPEKKTEEPRKNPEQEREVRKEVCIPSFYESPLFLGFMAQVCTVKLHDKLGFLILL